MENRPNITWRQHHLRLDITIRKPKSPCHHTQEVVDAVVATLIFIRVAMGKTNPPYPLAVAGKEEDETNPQYQKTWHGETLSLKDSIY
jgi:hypothetical protein